MNAKEHPFIVTEHFGGNQLHFNLPYLVNWLSKNDGGDSGEGFHPSKWKAELCKTSEERHDYILKTLNNRYLSPEFRLPDEVSARPSLLIFQNWKLQATYKSSFTITNRSKHALELYCEVPLSECIQVNTDHLTLKRLPPRQAVVVTVSFTPCSDEDQLYVIRFLSKKGSSFKIPVLAVGPRYIASCNDCVHIDEAYVNIPSSANFPVSNIGPKHLDIILHVDPPFSVEPTKLFLEPHANVVVTVTMKATTEGKHNVKLRLKHGTGEQMFVDVIGIAVFGDITLDKNMVMFDGVYLNTEAKQTVILQSNVHHPVCFSWRRYKTEGEENSQMDKASDMVQKISNSKKVGDIPDLLSQTILERETQLADALDFFLFQDQSFGIYPLTGTILPNSQFECMVFFHPKVMIPAKTVKAYLHIECRIDRAELELKGFVQGPRIDPNITFLDMKFCEYLSKRGVEITFSNNGVIKGTVTYANEHSGFIMCEPHSIHLNPLESKVVVLLVNFINKGPFLIELNFTIKESGERLTTCLKGTVIGMPITIDTNELDFGFVALGFSNLLKFSFTNDSDAVFEYLLFIARDGTEPPLRISDFHRNIRKKLPVSPKEFNIVPEKGVIQPKTRLTVEVEFIPNKYYAKPVEISFSVNGSIIEDLTIPIKYYCHHPMITCSPLEFDLPYMILNEPTEIRIALANERSVPVGYVISLIGDDMIATFSMESGILRPKGKHPITITLVPVELGSGTVTIGLDIFGRATIDEVCWIYYVCEPPSLSWKPSKLNWHITSESTAADLTKELTLYNPFKRAISCRIEVESPVIWLITPTTVEIEMEQLFTITPKVIDFGTTVFTLFVLYDNQKHEMKLTVHSSICTAILTLPDIFKGYDFENCLKNEVYCKTVKYINLGKKKYTVISKPRELDIYTNPFSIKPRSFVIKPNEELEGSLEFRYDKFGSHHTTFDVQCIDDNKKCVLGSCFLKAVVVPRRNALLCDPEILKLRNHDVESRLLQGALKITTVVSSLTEILCKIDHPCFNVVGNDGKACTETTLQFNPFPTTFLYVLFQAPIDIRKGHFEAQVVISVEQVDVKKTVKVVADVSYPHFTWSTQKLDFGCLFPMQDGHKELTLRNDCTIPLKFHCQYLSIKVTRPAELNEDEEGEEELEDFLSRPTTGSSTEVSSAPFPEVKEEPKIAASKKPLSIEQNTKSPNKKKRSKKLSKPYIATSDEKREEDLPLPKEQCAARTLREVTDTLIPVLNKSIQKCAERAQDSSIQLRQPVSLDVFNEYFMISPMHGEVSPGESAVLSIAYHPTVAAVRVEAEVGVFRDDNYQETLELVGICMESFHYEISPLAVDFGTIAFCEIATFNVTVTNMTECPLDIEVFNIKDDADDKRFGLLCVKPAVSTVDPHSSGVLTVVVHPCVFKRFFKKFQIKIHGIHNEILSVTGESSIRFFHLDLPFPVETVPLLEQYNGLRVLFNRLITHPEETEAVIPRELSDVCLASPGDDFDWEILNDPTSYKEIPGVQDIIICGTVMGLAEKAAQENCQDYHEHAVNKGEMDPLPHLVLPTHVLDLGCTILEEENRARLRLANYSPFDLKYTCGINRTKTELITMGLKLDRILDKAHFLRTGDITEHGLIFHPRKEHYNLTRKPHIKMSWLLTIKLECGPVLPIKIKTVISKPNVSIQPVVDFGHVKCNEKLIAKLTITNENVTDCDWSVKMDNSFYVKHRKTTPEGTCNPFTIEGPKLAGTLSPMSNYELSISFEPPSAGEFTGKLKVDVDNRRLTLYAELKGVGLCPNIEFAPPQVDFAGIIPYSGFSEQVLTIWNKGKVPVELYLPECKAYFMEQFMLRSVLDYMQKDVCYVPARSRNDTVVDCLHDLFSILVEKAKQYVDVQNIKNEDNFTIVRDYLQMLNGTEGYEYPEDLLSTLHVEAVAKKNVHKFGGGRLIVCTGAPTVDYIHEANLMASAMNMNVASFDQLFFEELSQSGTETASEIRALIDREFHKIMDDFDLPPEVAGNDLYAPILWRMKVEAVRSWTDDQGKNASRKGQKTGNANQPQVDTNDKSESQIPKSKKEGKSRSKDKSGSAEKDEAMRTPSLNISTATIIKHLTGRFQELVGRKGLIIDRLTSIIVKEPLAVLNILLTMCVESDRKDFVNMFSTLDKAMARFDLSEEIESQNLKNKKLRFSEICLFDDEKFNALNQNDAERFLAELKRRYIVCHGGGEIKTSSQSRRAKSVQTKMGIKSPKSKRAMSYDENRKRTLRKSKDGSRKSQDGAENPSADKRNLYNMKLQADFVEYEAQQSEINSWLYNTSKKNLADGPEKEINVWVINSEPHDVDSLMHELIQALLQWDEFRPPKRNVVSEEPAAINENNERLFRLDRPKFINEIDGRIDGIWFPSITHTFGVYSADKGHPFCIYPIDPANVFCGISRMPFRRSKWWPEEQTVSQIALKSGEKVSCLIVFQPKETGVFGKTLRVNIAGWPASTASVEIEGVSDIPHIDLDMRTLFPPHCYTYEELPARPSLTAVHHTILEMGCAAIPRTKGDKKFQVKSSLIFKNTSRVTGSLLFSIMTPEVPFELENDAVALKPGESFTLNVYAFPWREGFRTCDIVVSIEDNPMPLFIEARVEGITLNLTVDPQVISFQKVLLSIKKTAHLKIKNDLWIPIEWKFVEKIIQLFPVKFSKTSGVLDYQQSVIIDIYYCPVKVQELELDLDILVRPVSEKKMKFEKCHTLSLKVSSRDVILDIRSSTTGTDRLLEFDEAYINTELTKSFLIANKSHYPINYSINHFTDYSVYCQKVFSFNPAHGTLSRYKEDEIIITAKSSRPISFKALPALVAEIWDVTEQMAIAEIRLMQTVNFVVPSFKIIPLEDFSFGNLAVGEQKSIRFVIENTGGLPLNYTIAPDFIPVEEDKSRTPLVSLAKPQIGKKGKRGRKKNMKTEKNLTEKFVIHEPEKLPRVGNKGRFHPKKGANGVHRKKAHQESKHLKHAKPKSAPANVNKPSKSIRRVHSVVSERFAAKTNPRLTRKNRSTILRRSLKRGRPVSLAPSTPAVAAPTSSSRLVVGPFTVDNAKKTLNPNEIAEIVLTFKPEDVGEWKQKFYFNVENSLGKVKTIEITGNGLLPSISHSVYHVLVDALINLDVENERQILQKGFPCNTYHEYSHRLECCNYIVGQRTPFYVYLFNDGLVTSKVDLFFSGNQHNCFTFGEGKFEVALTIPPQATIPLEMAFEPINTERTSVTAILQLSLPKGWDNPQYVLNITGKGCIPRVAITKPDDYDRPENKYFLNVGQAFLNHPSSDFFSFRNIGTVAARVVIELPRKPSVFSFKAMGDYGKMLKHSSNDPLIDPFAVTLTPEQELSVIVEYSYTSSFKTDTCLVYIHVIGNPYEKLVLEIYGKGVEKELIADLPIRTLDMEAKLVRRKANLHHGTRALSQTYSESGGRTSKENFQYEIDFGNVETGQFVKKIFTLTNCSYFTYRVVFPRIKKFWIIPSLFHIGPSSTREIIALFRSDDDILGNDVITATYESIAFVTSYTDDWDNCPQFLSLIFKPEKHIKEEDLLEAQTLEPAYEQLSGKVLEPRTLSVYVHGQAGLPSLTVICPLIHFPLTNSGEESHAVLLVKNVGFMPADCCFNMDSVSRESWLDMEVSNYCSIGLLSSKERQTLKAKAILNVNFDHSFDLLDSKRKGYLYAPTPLKITDPLDDVERKSLREESSSIKNETEDLENSPFHFEPNILHILPGEIKYFKVTFRPTEGLVTKRNAENCVYTCKGILKETNQDESHDFELRGETIFCPCHIACEPGKPQWEDQELNHNLKIIDIRATFVGSNTKKVFELVNVTSEPYRFFLENLDMGEPNVFCEPMQGIIKGYSMAEVTVHFNPTSTNTVKSTWKLSIPSLPIEQEILFVGRTSQPDVKLVPPVVTMPPFLIGMPFTASFEVVNSDEFDYEFKLRPLPLAVGDIECNIVPKDGLSPAHTSTPVKITVTSRSSGHLNIQIALTLKNYREQTISTIFTEFFELKCILYLHLRVNGKKKLDPDSTNEIALGYIEPGNPQSVAFTLANFGQRPIRYKWVGHESCREDYGIEISFDSSMGMVQRQESQKLLMMITTSNHSDFKKCIVQLQILRGPTFSLCFSGHSILLYKFSFRKFDFGNCPILQTGVCNYVKTLDFTNQSKQPILFESMFSNKPHLKVLWSCGVVNPGETVSIMVEFYPLDQVHYSENVVFSLNRVIEEAVVFLGKGLEIVVKLIDPHDDVVDMQGVPVNSSRTKSKKIINQSPVGVGCEIEMETRRGLTVKPLSFIVKKRSSQGIMITYSPESKSPPFSTEVYMNAGGIRSYLFNIKCSTYEISVKLDKKIVLLGKAVKYCTVKSSVNIINDGDIGVDYIWNLGKLGSVLTVNPMDGYLAPHSVRRANLSFLSMKKMTVHDKITLRYSEGSQFEELKIIGEFTEIPDPSQTIFFKTDVRNSTERSVDLENKTEEPLLLFPILIGDFYSALDFIEVPAKAKTKYSITYVPLTMTSTTRHSGRLFVPYPDGSCVYYSLIGEAGQPQPEDEIEWMVMAKSQEIQYFKVKNWLNSFQRLRASISLDEADKIPKGLVSILGEPTVCLPPQDLATYPVDVMVCKAMNFSFKIYFVNPETQEYLHFHVRVKSLAPIAIPYHEARAHLGNASKTQVKLTNPFIEPVKFKFYSPVPEIKANDVTVEPYSEGHLMVEYTPLIMEPAKVVTCKVSAPPFDDMTYTFYLLPQPRLTGPPIHVEAPLGDLQQFTVTVPNNTKQNVFYIAVIQSDDLTIQGAREFEIASNKEYSLIIIYEPEEIGSKQQNIEFHSTTGETLRYEICTTCILPKPVGPINVAAGSSETIIFKNVFNQPADFSMALSEYIFAVTVDKSIDDYSQHLGIFRLQSKETVLITVELRLADVIERRPIDNFSFAEKLEINLFKKNSVMLDEHEVIQWVYYLKGIIPNNIEASETHSSIDQDG